VTTAAPLLTTAVLEAATKTPHAPKGGEGVKSGPIGLAVILVLCIAAYFLFKSMSKHLRKVREEFPAHAGDEHAAPHDSSSAASPTAASSSAPAADQPTDPSGTDPPPPRESPS
jgi:hypothetical protein